MTSTAATPAIPVVAGAPPTSGVATPTQTAQAPASDFLLMLGQLIGANAAPVAQPALTEEGAVEGELSNPKERNENALQDVALFNVTPIAIAPIVAPQPSAPVVENDALAMRGMTGELNRVRQSVVTEASAGFNAEVLSELSAEPAPTLDAPAGRVEPLHISAAPLETAPARAAVQEAMLSRPIQAPVGSQPWADEISARLTMMADAGKQTASLRLSPEHLGPLEISIAINDDQASVWFGAAHADTRAAIEHALPRLRELFEASGMSLADAGVHHQTPRGGEANQTFRGGVTGETADDEGGRVVNVAVNTRLLDAYA